MQMNETFHFCYFAYFCWFYGNRTLYKVFWCFWVFLMNLWSQEVLNDLTVFRRFIVPHLMLHINYRNRCIVKLLKKLLILVWNFENLKRLCFLRFSKKPHWIQKWKLIFYPCTKLNIQTENTFLQTKYNIFTERNWQTES